MIENTTTKLLISYVFTNKELLSLIEINNINNNQWSEDWITKHSKNYTMLGQSLAKYLSLDYCIIEKSNQEKCHFIGYSIDSQIDAIEASKLIENNSIDLMKLFKTQIIPKLYFYDK